MAEAKISEWYNIGRGRQTGVGLAVTPEMDEIKSGKSDHDKLQIERRKLAYNKNKDGLAASKKNSDFLQNATQKRDETSYTNPRLQNARLGLNNKLNLEMANPNLISFINKMIQILKKV